MSITVALTHRTSYRYDRPVSLRPQVVRLRPAPHTRTAVVSYAQRVSPREHFCNWQQDPFGNWNARLVFPERVDHLTVEIDLLARLDAINPFDFFLEEDATEVPFSYHPDLRRDLAPYLGAPEVGPLLDGFLEELPPQAGSTNDFMVALNQHVQTRVGYVVRLEPGVQTAEQTLASGKGSCRDSGWLLVQVLRHLGYAARFVSGYLIQLTADEKPIDGPAGPDTDFTDLHAWAEVFLPGAGWVGLDPTSGLFASEGHIPLAATPEPRSAAPITGSYASDAAVAVDFDFHMDVRRVVEVPRVTKPVTDLQWAAVTAAGDAVDARARAADMRLTVGGEPTFVSAHDRDAPEWTVEAVGPTKRAHAEQLIRRLKARFAPDGLLHFGQGKWYPGERLPRWAFALYWRGDGLALWRDDSLIAPETASGTVAAERAGRFAERLAETLGVEPAHAQPAWEDTAAFLLRERMLPDNVDPADSRLEDPEERARMARVFERGLGQPTAWVLPIQEAQARDEANVGWRSELWRTRRGKLFLVPGDSPAGFRLPLQALPWLPEAARPQPVLRDPFAPAAPLPEPARILRQRAGHPAGDPAGRAADLEAAASAAINPEVVRTALTVEPRGGTLAVFLPPVGSAEAYVHLIAAVEETASALGQPVHVEGYPPPPDSRLNVIKVTPDPGVVEVNIHPAHSWREQVAITEAVYEEARQCRLEASSFQVDGRPTGSGGGNHIVVGGPTPPDSPFLRRPDLLASVIRYWQRHPSLSYLFSGLFIGPTSQAPRLDEARREMLDEMEIALDQLPPRTGREGIGPEGGATPPWLVDRLFRHLLVDVTGNTHRAEICIDKLYSPDGPTGRLGLVEFRGFEMPPHARMAAAQALVIRALLGWFWETPFEQGLVRHGRALHDRYLLPHFLEADFAEVLADLSRAFGLGFDPAWFAAQAEFRFPRLGETAVEGARIELRTALEPWNVLGEEGIVGGVARYVDSSLERLQIKVTGDFHEDRPGGLPPGCALACNGVEVPLTHVAEGTWVAGLRFRAWQPPACLHPTIPAHGPLTFDVVERETGRSRGGCTYHVAHPGGRAHETRPINALEAEGRRLARFEPHAHSPGRIGLRSLLRPAGDVTTDLRRAHRGGR